MNKVVANAMWASILAKFFGAIPYISEISKKSFAPTTPPSTRNATTNAREDFTMWDPKRSLAKWDIIVLEWAFIMEQRPNGCRNCRPDAKVS